MSEQGRSVQDLVPWKNCRESLQGRCVPCHVLIMGCIAQKFKMWRTSCCKYTSKEAFIVRVCPVLLQAAVEVTVVCFTDMLLLLTVLVRHW
jgi:hypothetical protein